MSNRNWQADWELAMRATPGPWEAKAITAVSGPMRMPTIRAWEIHGFREDGSRLVDWVEEEEDAQFIVEARMGWPAALEERARLAERVRELEKAVELRKNLHRAMYNYISEIRGYSLSSAVDYMRAECLVNKFERALDGKDVKPCDGCSIHKKWCARVADISLFDSEGGVASEDL